MWILRPGEPSSEVNAVANVDLYCKHDTLCEECGGQYMYRQCSMLYSVFAAIVFHPLSYRSKSLIPLTLIR